MPELFTPLRLRSLTIPNRIVVSPMCQYSAVEGRAQPWHAVHLGRLALSGAGLVLIEATGVEPAGRISPGCLGLYDDATEEVLAGVLRTVRSVGGAPIGIQLGHAGRKASTARPWEGGGQIPADAGGWTTVAPSAVPMNEGEAPPHALGPDELQALKARFVDAVLRADRLGLDAIEVHAAHGYLLHQFLSPLSNQRTDLARLWFWREYARMTRRPRWVELTLALENNDRPAMALLLQKDLERLPYRDAIEAAVRTGQTPLAETIAFDRFQVNDRDYLLDNQVRDLFGSRSGGLRYRLSLMDREGVGFLDQLLSVTTAMTPRFSLKLEAGNTDIRHQKTDVVGIYPASIRTARMGATMRHTGGSAELYAGFRDALYIHPQAGLLGNWKLTSRLSLEMDLVSGAESDESIGLKIGGMKDELRLGLQHGLTPRDTLLLRLSGSILRDQQWRRLGDRGSFEAELTHRILFTGPDTTLRFFSGYHNFNRGPDPVDRTALLIPAQQRATSGSAYFVPESLAQVGVGIMVGEEARDNYTRNWRPFGALDVSWNSNSGSGFYYRVGLVGPVLGLDKLEGAFSQGSGSFGTSDVNSHFDLSYRYYFR